MEAETRETSNVEMLVSKQQLSQDCHQGTRKGMPDPGLCLCKVLLAFSWVISSSELLAFAFSQQFTRKQGSCTFKPIVNCHVPLFWA